MMSDIAGDRGSAKGPLMGAALPIHRGRQRVYRDVPGRDSPYSKMPGVKSVLPFLSLLELLAFERTSINHLVV